MKMWRTIGIGALAFAALSGYTCEEPPAMAEPEKEQPSADQQMQAAKMAPAFEAMGSDGKQHSLESLTKDDTTLVMYFISETCPINAAALPHYKKIVSAHKDAKKIKMVGVFNGDEAAFKRWNAKEKVPFLTLYDPNLKIIKDFDAKFSPWQAMVSPDKKVTKVVRGYSQGSLNDLNNMYAKIGGTEVAKLEYPGAPQAQSGG